MVQPQYTILFSNRQEKRRTIWKSKNRFIGILSKKDADLTFRSVFDFVNCKDFTSFMLECQSKKCNVLFYDENIFFDFKKEGPSETFKRQMRVALLTFILESIPAIAEDYLAYFKKYAGWKSDKTFTPTLIEKKERLDRETWLDEQANIM